MWFRVVIKDKLRQLKERKMADEKKSTDDKAQAEKEYTVVDKDDENFEIDTYPTQEEAQKRIALLSSQGARPDRYEVKEGAKGDHEKKKKEMAEKHEKFKQDKNEKGTKAYEGAGPKK